MTMRGLMAIICLLVGASAFDAVGQARPDSPNWMNYRTVHLLYNRGSSLPPAVYQLRALHADKCVGRVAGAGTEVAHLALVECGDEAALAFLMHRERSRYTVRAAHTQSDRGRYTLCVTVARGVVLGPKRLDLLPCDLPRYAEWGDAGVRDQVFWPFNDTFDLDPSRPIKIGLDSECWDVRGGGRDLGTDLILWTCHGGANQRFELVYVGPLNEQEQTFHRAEGWRPGPEGQPPRRANFAPGIDLPGSDYESGSSPNDGGVWCATRCASDERCRAFTWSAPGVADESAMCWLKDANPPAVPNAGTASGYVAYWPGR